jgi:hypothetical protein
VKLIRNILWSLLRHRHLLTHELVLKVVVADLVAAGPDRAGGAEQQVVDVMAAYNIVYY